jgi:predicted DNA-binding transcriptional regulator AlpA
MYLLNGEDRIVRMPELVMLVGLSRAQIYIELGRNAFPRPVKLAKQAKGWRMSTIQNWLAARPAA